MTFTIEIDDQLARQVDLAARKTGKARSAFVHHAFRDWLRHKPEAWPAKVMDFKGTSQAPRFERERSDAYADVSEH